MSGGSGPETRPDEGLGGATSQLRLALVVRRRGRRRTDPFASASAWARKVSILRRLAAHRGKAMITLAATVLPTIMPGECRVILVRVLSAWLHSIVETTTSR
jgi:hypothetical protein